MKFLRPLTITEGMLVSSTVAEDDYAAWSSGTTYAVGDRAIKSHVIWESAQAGNINHDPEAAGTTYWVKVSSTNRWRMFDATVNSQTTSTSTIVVELQPGAVINAVGAIELRGQSMTVELLDGATVVYSRTKSIDVSPVTNWYEYFFGEFEYASVLLFEDIPAYLHGTLRITVTGHGQVACGGVLVGKTHALGVTTAGATAGITDYSRKSTNTFGVTEVVERPFSKRMSLRFYLDTARIAWLQSLLASVRATPCLYFAEESDVQRFGPLNVCGFYRDFSIDVPGRLRSYCSMEIEGII